MQTEKPYWLAEAYEESICITDTGMLARNTFLAQIMAVLLYFLFNKQASFVDYAGGYGVFVRLMRDKGFDFYWHDVYTNNIFAKGFEYCDQKAIDLVSSFESFEHFVDPRKEIESMLAIAPSLLFTTQLLPNPIPQPNEWWYYACNQGQHISFYSVKTFEYLSQCYGLHFHSHWGIHLLTRKKINGFAFKKLVEHHMRLFKFVVKRMKSKTVSDSQQVNCHDSSRSC